MPKSNDTNQPKRLIFQCKFVRLSVKYEATSVCWTERSARFEVIDEDDGQCGVFSVWADGIEPDQIREIRNELHEVAHSFMLGLLLLQNRKIEQIDYKLSYITDLGIVHLIKSDNDIECIVRRSRGEDYNFMSISLSPYISVSGVMEPTPAPLPIKMPCVPTSLKRHVFNVIQAEELDINSEHYEDEQLKRWFLILEELESSTAQGYNEIKWARDFVSHPVVRNKRLIRLLKNELPSSVYLNQQGCEEARYLRDDPLHRTFVSKYEVIARRWATRLVKEEVSNHGGHV